MASVAGRWPSPALWATGCATVVTGHRSSMLYDTFHVGRLWAGVRDPPPVSTGFASPCRSNVRIGMHARPFRQILRLSSTREDPRHRKDTSDAATCMRTNSTHSRGGQRE